MKGGSVLYKIITNNKKVYNAYSDVEFVEGSFRDVLMKTRDYVHLGYSLVQHPLPASIRMIFSPVRTIIIIDVENDFPSSIMIENAIEKYDLTMGKREPDMVNEEDYKALDLSLTNSAIKEISNFVPMRR